MSTIPFKALNMGGESIHLEPVKYNKSRISGSKRTTFNLHIKGACMPGQKDMFTVTSSSKPSLNSSLLYNQNMSRYRQDKIESYNYKKPNENIIPLEFYKINEFVPNDDEAFLIAINTLYRNIFGNLSLMESERPVDLERKLRNGDITIKEFTRKVCKSNIYKEFYFNNISQYKSIALRYKHILGRPIINQSEISESSNIINKLGFESHIDWLIDSEEYHKVFGEDIVPYIRSWNSAVGLTTKSFLKTASITKCFATSDIC